MDTTFKEVDMHNYTSATNSAVRARVEETICDEIRQGNCYFHNQIDGRKHHDCSRPHGHAVSDYITTGSTALDIQHLQHDMDVPLYTRMEEIFQIEECTSVYSTSWS